MHNLEAQLLDNKSSILALFYKNKITSGIIYCKILQYFSFTFWVYFDLNKETPTMEMQIKQNVCQHNKALG
jgi:hypothetical protein